MRVHLMIVPGYVQYVRAYVPRTIDTPTAAAIHGAFVELWPDQRPVVGQSGAANEARPYRDWVAMQIMFTGQDAQGQELTELNALQLLAGAIKAQAPSVEILIGSPFEV